MRTTITQTMKNGLRKFRLAGAACLGMLLAGSLSAQVITYEEYFPNGTVSSGGQQCANWTSFRNQLTNGLPYYRLTLSTSVNSTVIECNNPTIVALIASALRTGTAGTWTDGSNTWNVGSCGNGPELSVNSGNCQCPNPGWVVRPCINNNNWGGIGTATCGGPSQTMKVQFFANQEDHDLYMDKFVTPVSACGSNTDQVSFIVKNWGLNSESNIPFECKVTGTLNGNPVNQTLTQTYTNTIPSLGQETIVFNTTVNTNGIGTLTFKVYSQLGTDDDRTNDTITLVKVFKGSPNNPGLSNIDRCGVGTVQLTATPDNSVDSIMWFDAASGGNYLGQGVSMTSPFINQTTNFYAAAARYGTPTNIENSSTLYTYISGSTSIENGGMFNITPTETMILNDLQVMKINSNNANWKVYMRTGSYIGNQNNANAWDLVAERTNVPGQANTFTTINVGGIILQAGVTYGFYIQCLGTDVWIQYSGTQYTGFNTTNSDMTIQGGCQLYGAWGQNGTYPNYHMNLRLNYTNLCLSNRVQMTATVKPMPNGTTISKGSTFNGQYNSGTGQDPDITASNDVIEYQIEPPTGYQNSGFGSTWGINLLTLKTPNGTDLPPSDYNVVNPGAGNGRIEITPPVGFSDSLIIGTVSVTALGCDTLIYRTFFIAPRPNIGFSANPSCEGEGMQFNNTTTIASGTISYLWDFGDGNTSVLINPKHIYATAGTYDVTLVATSNYGYTEQITVQVTVYENPTAEFSYQNVCEGSATPFTDASIIPAGTPTYVWDFGDGSAMGSGANPSHQYNATGVYSVTMTVTANGCSGSTMNYVTYAPRAVPDFTTSMIDCNNDPVSFMDQSTLSSGQMGYSWDFGDNTTSTNPNPTHLYSAYGIVNVTLTVTTDFGCVDMLSKQINLTEAPIADFSNTMLCDKDNADFLNLSSEPAMAQTSYEWWFSDGSIYTTKDVNRNFPSVGKYTVTLKAVADNGCIDEVTKTISVDEEPAPQFFGGPVCEGEDVTLLNASTGNNGDFTSSWDFGGGMTSTDQNPTVSLPAGSHAVTLVVSTPSGCEATLVKNVEVTAKPVVNTMEVVSGELGDGTMNLIADVSPANVNYIIFWGDGGRENGTANGSEIIGSYPYLADGLFEVKLQLENSGCITESTTESVVFRTAVINAVQGELSVYPNPNNGHFTLDLGTLNAANASIRVYTANGMEVVVNPVINGSSAELDLSTVAAGVYWISVSTETGVYTTRVTITN